MSHKGFTVSAVAAREFEQGRVQVPLASVAARSALEPGQPLRVLDPAGRPLGLAIADPENDCVRLLARADEGVDAIDEAFVAGRVTRAHDLRVTLGLTGEGRAYRLLNGSGDGLPGFTADVFASWAVLHVYARGLVSLGRQVADAMRAQSNLRGVVIKVRSRGAASQGKVRHDIVGDAPPDALTVFEEGVPFEVHLTTGLNVGLFTDMRAHRHGLARFVRGRSVLNGFSYTGSLSVVAARAGASAVTSVDLSAGVLNWARDNFVLSGLDPARAIYRFAADDVGRYVANAARDHRAYDVIVLDPPTFSAARGASFSIERDYAPLIAAAVAVVSPGGVLWLACNTREISLTAIAQAGLQRAGREAQLLETGGLPPDYPTVLGHPEDRYLQVGVFRIV
jgi:23S rRNA (cytosine1962-C5)-methyltransferase